ncbi:MAG: response regulator transcription factor [Proteobacteria bacterium]|nr:response regulator transcription factor [Pseudomonadota bacterium]
MPEGTSIWKQVRVYPILDAEGRTELVVKIGLDVTSEKHRQRRLDRYLRQLETSIQEAEPEPSPSSSEGETERERFFGLTDRELEVLRLLARGFTNARIAGLLDISLNTVKTHVSHIFDKLDVGDRVRAAILAARLKLV